MLMWITRTENSKGKLKCGNKQKSHTLEDLGLRVYENPISAGLMYAVQLKNGNISYREICDILGSYAA